MNPVEIRNLHFRYSEGTTNIINGVDLVLGPGQITAILGLSGCGKSTLCYCICGIIPHVYEGDLEGEILIYGNPSQEIKLPVISTKVGIVFQDPDSQLFSPTVEDEIAFGPENLCIDRKEIGRRIDENLKVVNMEKYRFAHPEQLSGGEKQLIAIASVLALQPEVLLFDESMSQIDTDGRGMIRKVIKRLRDNGRAILMVEHDIDNIDIADKVFFMKEGRLTIVESKKEGDVIGFYKTS
jgi:energy-coupling factor transport system ATP-binding protein